MKRYLLTAAGPDRPGIVAEVTKILYELGCNLEDSAMTRLRGEFAILLMFSTPKENDTDRLREGLDSLGKRLKLSVQVKPLSNEEAKTSASSGTLCLVTVYGADHPGIVHHITQVLAKYQVNITDVTTHRTEPEEKKGKSPGYILYVEGEVPTGVTLERLDTALQESGKELGVTVSVKPQESTPL